MFFYFVRERQPTNEELEESIEEDLDEAIEEAASSKQKKK